MTWPFQNKTTSNTSTSTQRKEQRIITVRRSVVGGSEPSGAGQAGAQQPVAAARPVNLLDGKGTSGNPLPSPTGHISLEGIWLEVTAHTLRAGDPTYRAQTEGDWAEWAALAILGRLLAPFRPDVTLSHAWEQEEINRLKKMAEHTRQEAADTRAAVQEAALAVADTTVSRVGAFGLYLIMLVAGLLGAVAMTWLLYESLAMAITGPAAQWMYQTFGGTAATAGNVKWLAFSMSGTISVTVVGLLLLIATAGPMPKLLWLVEAFFVLALLGLRLGLVPQQQLAQALTPDWAVALVLFGKSAAFSIMDFVVLFLLGKYASHCADRLTKQRTQGQAASVAKARLGVFEASLAACRVRLDETSRELRELVLLVSARDEQAHDSTNLAKQAKLTAALAYRIAILQLQGKAIDRPADDSEDELESLLERARELLGEESMSELLAR
jgi:hypothetical protein